MFAQDRILNLLFGCRHRRITRPITPVHKPRVEPGNTYVACLECGKQFHYDLKNMRIGTAVPIRTVSERSETGTFQAQY